MLYDQISKGPISYTYKRQYINVKSITVVLCVAFTNKVLSHGCKKEVHIFTKYLISLDLNNKTLNQFIYSHMYVFLAHNYKILFTIR